MIDLHAHVLPGIDDGPGEIDEAVAMCRDAAAEGVKVIVATPHMFCGIGTDDIAAIEAATDRLRNMLEQQQVECRLQYAGEIRLVEDLLERIGRGEAPFYDQSRRYLLIETPPVGDVSEALQYIIFQLRLRGMAPLIAHPERVDMFIKKPALLEQVVRQGAVLQVTATSLLMNDAASALAMDWIQRGWVGVVAGDMHNKARPANMGEAYRAVRGRFNEGLAQLLFDDNPRRILAGERLPEAGT